MTGKQWHQMDAAEVLAQLETSAEIGLSGDEAKRRLVEHGPNELRVVRRVSPWRVFLEQFKNVLILILLVAVVLSAFLGHTIEAVTILVIVLFAAGLGFVQEYRAERALEALREMAAPTAAVLRDEHEVSVPARDVVPGDILYLRTGDKIAAYGPLIDLANVKGA